MEDLFNFFEKCKHYARFANSGEEHFNQEPLDNGNFERLNEGINTFISQEEILCSFPFRGNFYYSYQVYFYNVSQPPLLFV
jgi:hypothetical protein